ncbi:glucan 1,3-beta-glucosidase [Podospora fimiseda]|uniref:Glucan 1,3-beta-glucosidase n=1 Tax=Podospora fimiseda TaxID=252190 RepID=A0AAN7BEM8_9PEZI|nr:glucan 1,3-beta-glucosidase [Podospora fimiseda]
MKTNKISLFLLGVIIASFTSGTTSSQLLEPRQSSCLTPTNPSKWWRSQISPRNGSTPLASDSTYQYYRTPIQFGADPTGVNDSSLAFNLAITSQNRTANTVTTLPAYIYIPPGTYLISFSINLLVNTFLIGDANNPPILIADPGLGINSVINAFDPFQGEGSANKNFFVALRNIKVDMTRVDLGIEAKGINWSVSQGCSLTNIEVIMVIGGKHKGIVMEPGGSGAVISDLRVIGGGVGVEVKSQQYLLRGVWFEGTEVGVSVKRGYMVVIQGGGIKGGRYGVEIEEGVGGVEVVDFEVEGVEEAGVNLKGKGGQVVVDGLRVIGGGGVGVRRGEEVLLKGGLKEGESWVMGNVHPDGYQTGKIFPIRKPPGLLDNDGKYFTKSVPQYGEYDISQVVNIKNDPEHKIYGDNNHDDGPAINAILLKHANCKIIFFPQGIYRTTTTIYVPPGSRLVGEVLSVITGYGPLFSSASSPQPIIQVGKPNSSGIAQFTDLLFSVADVLPGAIIIQVNMASPNPGDVGFWNCVIRVGGSLDSLVLPKCTSGDPSTCKAAFALLHLTKTASAYLEDIWGWVADHGLDPLGSTLMPAQTISVGRGLLVETTSPTWLIGTSFEHCSLYQYALRNASNLFIVSSQTESPYWQGKNTPARAPAPWDINTEYGDPTFRHCLEGDDQCYRGWGMYISHTKDTVIHGSSLWVFFNKMNDNMWKDPQCLETGGVCQTNMVWVEGAKRLFWYLLSTKSTENMVYEEEGGGKGVVKQSDVPGGWGGVMAAYLRDSGEENVDDDESGAAAGVLGVKGVLVLAVVGLYTFWSLM